MKASISPRDALSGFSSITPLPGDERGPDEPMARLGRPAKRHGVDRYIAGRKILKGRKVGCPLKPAVVVDHRGKLEATVGC